MPDQGDAQILVGGDHIELGPAGAAGRRADGGGQGEIADTVISRVVVDVTGEVVEDHPRGGVGIVGQRERVLELNHPVAPNVVEAAVGDSADA